MQHLNGRSATATTIATDYYTLELWWREILLRCSIQLMDGLYLTKSLTLRWSQDNQPLAHPSSQVVVVVGVTTLWNALQLDWRSHRRTNNQTNRWATGELLGAETPSQSSAQCAGQFSEWVTDWTVDQSTAQLVALRVDLKTLFSMSTCRSQMWELREIMRMQIPIVGTSTVSIVVGYYRTNPLQLV